MPDDSSEEQSLRRSVVRGLGWSGVGYPLTLGLVFLGQVLAAQLLRPGAFGSYSLAFTIFTLAALIAQAGLPLSLLRRASAALVREERAEARHEIASALLVGTISGFIAGIILASPLGSWFLENLFPRTAVAAVAVLIGVRTVLRVLENLLPEALRTFRMFARVALFNGLLMNVLLCGVLGAALVAGTHVTLDDMMVASIVTAAIALVPAIISVFRRLRALDRTRIVLRNPLEPATWISSIWVAIVVQLDLLVVGALGNSRQTALYSAAFRLAFVVSLPIIAVNQVVPPFIARWYAEGERSRLQLTLQATGGLALLGALLVLLPLVLFGTSILGLLFGDYYRGGYDVLVILALGQVAQTVAGSSGFALLMTGNQRVYAIILAISTPITLGLDIVGYHLAGIEGVAAATAIMLTLQNVAQVVAVRRMGGFMTVASMNALFREVQAARQRRRAGSDPAIDPPGA
ncbi:MAG: lipopolysaccharide biosynthesis protein [Acidimicrobiia bacterium]